MLKIGITGCIGSGKSTVASVFSHLGVPVYNADERAKWLMANDADLIAGIKKMFGTEAYQTDGRLNRTLIAKQAFEDRKSLDQLNALVHPAVYRDFDNWCAQQHVAYVIKEAALMFESESFKQLVAVIVVTAPEELRIQRAMQRDSITREAVLIRMNNQMSQEEKRSHAQLEIQNDEIHLIIPQVMALHQQFTQGN